MVDVNKAITARIKKQGENFEILVNDCEKALEFREGKVPLDEILVINEIFKDVKKGLHASEHEMQKIFGTSDKKKIAEIIINEGEIQLTAEYQKKLREEKRKKIINLIHRNAVDPKTSLPHPVTRIENALNEAKVNIDYNKTAESQVQDVIKQINRILPISYEIREISIKIPARFSGKSYSILKQFGKILKDEWQPNGDLTVIIEVPAGMQSDLFDNLNAMAHGQVESKIIKKR